MLISKLEKLSVIPNKNIPQTIWPAPVFRKDQLGLQLFIVPVREVRSENIPSGAQRFIDINKSSWLNGN